MILSEKQTTCDFLTFLFNKKEKFECFLLSRHIHFQMSPNFCETAYYIMRVVRGSEAETLARGRKESFRVRSREYLRANLN